MRSAGLLLLLFLLGLPEGLRSQEPEHPLPEVHAHTLANGLRLFIIPRPGAPTVSFALQYRIGSVNETEGVTGIAHLLEHLLFKGTTTIGTRDYGAELPVLQEMDRVHDSLVLAVKTEPSSQDSVRIQKLRDRFQTLKEEASGFVISNEFDAILSRNGAQNLNATTTTEATTYFVELPSNRTELWFILEADRMSNPVFREFFSERDVVAEERRTRLESNPSGLLYVAHLAEAFRVHPYGRPVIGSMGDIQSLSRKEVEAYHRRYYGPNNAVVAIAGDVDPDQILQWAHLYFGPIPRGEDPPEVGRREPEQTSERRIEVVFDAEPALRIGWKIPGTLHPDTPALAMLASLLTGGRSSRVYRRLVSEDRIATAVTSGSEPGYLYPGLFSIDAFPRSPHTTQEVEAAIYEEVDRLKTTPPDEVEVQRVRNQLEAAEIRRLQSSFGLAIQVAQSASLFGDWRRSFDFTQAMEAVTPEDIQRVVHLYFREDGRTVATLVKGPGPGGVR